METGTITTTMAYIGITITTEIITEIRITVMEEVTIVNRHFPKHTVEPTYYVNTALETADSP